eukprot:TRINITY_DN530_c0_g1_i5.p1 TRINITY_DN530_c0_g1~~TRINITY_DN530_c0_g1_i5.p1  ORF type:complete len:448 (-),score=81.52 TRINITY_DN530_c0_g1_i5:197-1540(-)
MPIVTVFKCQGSAEVQQMRLSDNPTVEEVKTKIKEHFHFTEFSLVDSGDVAILNDEDLGLALGLDPPVISITNISKGAQVVPGGNTTTEELVGAMSELMIESRSLNALVKKTLVEAPAFTDATPEFVTKLLKPFCIEYHTDFTRGPKDYPEPRFSWVEGEPMRTKAAIEKCQELLEDSVDGMELFDARGSALRVAASQQLLSNGFLDAGIRVSAPDPCALPFSFALGGVEFKSDVYPLKLPQMIFELVAMSIVSAYGQGVANMGTDFITKWAVLWFDKPNHIMVMYYESGLEALAKFRELLSTCQKRGSQLGKSRLVEDSAGEDSNDDDAVDEHNNADPDADSDEAHDNTDNGNFDEENDEKSPDNLIEEREQSVHSGYDSQDLEDFDELEDGRRVTKHEVEAMRKLRYLEACAISFSDWSGDPVRVPYWASEHLHAEMRNAEMSAM